MILAGVRDDGLNFNQSTSSLIDVVFLLLIYFMVTAALIKKEGDISFILPVDIEKIEMPEIPVEVLVEVLADGTVEVEGMRFAYDDRILDGLVVQIAGLKEIAAAQNSPFFVNILPHQESIHRRIIDVMDACAAAKVKTLSFSRSM